MSERTSHALGAAVGFLLTFSTAGTVLAQDQRGTDSLPFVVKMILDQKPPLLHTSTDWWMFSVVGLLQLVVFGVQAWQLKKTVEATQKYAQTAREEMISAHPPNIIVRRIVLNPNIGDADFHIGNVLNGSFDVINRGRSKCTITQNHSMIFITDKALPMKPPYGSLPPHPLINISLETGYAYNDLPIREGVTINADIINATSPASNWKLYVMGWIDYLDSLGRPVARLYFCRVWSPTHYRFLPLDNPDYESEERA
jgi:hypothetical protein